MHCSAIECDVDVAQLLVVLVFFLGVMHVLCVQVYMLCSSLTRDTSTRKKEDACCRRERLGEEVKLKGLCKKVLENGGSVLIMSYGIQASMAAILACHPAVFTKLLGQEAILCEL